MVRLLVVAALMAGACRFDADYGGTSYRCDGQSACPDGFTCIDGICRTEPFDAGLGGGDAGEDFAVVGDVLTYTFDDYQPTDVAHDRSGHRHDGSDRSLLLAAGRYGQGLNLNGSPLDIPDTGDLFSPGSLTIEMWVFRDRDGTREALLSDYDAARAPADTELSLEVGPDDRLELLVAPDCETDGIVTAASEGTVPATTWTHVAAVWDGGEARFYLDGEPAGSAPLAGGCERAARFAIGARGDGSNDFVGQIDEVKLWSTARSPEAIRASMTHDSQAASATCGDLLIEGEACDGESLCCARCESRDGACGMDGTCGAAVCKLPSDVQRVSEGLVALYLFDEGAGNTIADSTMSNIDLTIGNAAGVTWGAGTLTVTGAAAITSAETNGAVAACVADGEVTIEAWVQPALLSREGRVAGVVATGSVNLFLSQANRAWTGGVTSAGSLENGHPVVDTPREDVAMALTHVVMVRTADGWRRLYIDGALRGTSSVGGALGWIAAERFILAADPDGSDEWRGTYHLVAVYCRALEELEVARNFAAGAG
ncbi:MAG TPA: LamG domain-containing protein [Kofleriaceae bacterium]